MRASGGLSSIGAACALIAAVMVATAPVTVTAASVMETPRRGARLQEDTCVTAGCATDDSCNDDDADTTCTTPASYVCAAQLPGLNVCESPELDAMLPCWMSDLEGTLALNEISIPATHDTMAKGVSACFQEGQGGFVFTQAWSLRTMLDAGVRALDIRLRHENDIFTLEHGAISLPYAFNEDVRDVLEAFLSDNPTETVIMIYQINELDSNTRTAEETFEESMAENADLWLSSSTVPTLDEARGKIVLANDMSSVEQNEFELEGFEGISGKKALVRDFFSDGAPVSDTLRLNYLSATGATLTSVHPLTVAAGLRSIFEGTNEVVFEFSAGCLGVVMMDYIGEDAIAHIVAQQGTTAPTWDAPVTTSS